jgi:membrane protein DedA with SNARE-associated domain
MSQILFSNEALLVVSLFFATFIYEDGATLLAATLAETGKVSPWLGLISVFLGIWLGDIGLYAVGAGLGQRALGPRWLGRLISAEKLRHASDWFSRRGSWALVISRVIPGTRLPLFFVAGALRFSPRKFAGVTGVCAAAWVFSIFAAGSLVIQHLRASSTIALLLVAAIVLALPTVFKQVWQRAGQSFFQFLCKYRRWEFWPAWVFYPPVAVICAWLGLRHRGFALPTVANPAFRNGGIVGESKIEILECLMQFSPEFTSDAFLIPAGELGNRKEQLRQLCEEHEISFPLVLKPNVGQRGEGFKLVADFADAEAYLNQVVSDVVLQRYVNDLKEVGIFYYRFPQERHGHIFAITQKIFPVLTGDGIRTIQQLIHDDPRASLIANVYLDRLKDIQDVILPAGQVVRLVEAGNHCQGCIFQDGGHLLTGALERRIDEISQKLPGFFVGRYDIRYSSDEDLQLGKNFKIIELNGAASEATNVYDSRNSLWSAYRTLYQQWELVYKIGRANRDRGHRSSSALQVFADWQKYRAISAAYPAAD